jgi:protein-tyrosine phosphatase
MIDLHTHILPGIDDGLESEDEAVEFARMAAGDGIETIVATPHCKDGSWENNREGILEKVARLRSRLEQEQIAVELLPGGEVHIAPELVERVKDGRAPTLADNGKTLLLELSLSQYPVELENLIFELKLAGLQVLMAHPERIKFFQEDPTRYEAIVRIGAYGQITTGSILGTFGTRAKEYSEELLSKGLVHVIASDAHNTQRRPPLLSGCVDAVTPWVGREYAEAMTREFPRALLDGVTPRIPPLEPERRPRRSFFSRLFGGN